MTAAAEGPSGRLGRRLLVASRLLDGTGGAPVDETAVLLDEVGRDDLGIVFDTWHLWDTDGLEEAIAREVGRLVAVHVADWRAETRNTDDRVFPGDGVADLPAIVSALDRAGWDGPYEVEIFSDPELPDSLWRLPPEVAASTAVRSLRDVAERAGS